MSSSEASDEPVPSPTASFTEYDARLQRTILDCAKTTSALPGKTDLNFQRTLNRKFSKDLDVCSSRILGFTNQLLELAQGLGSTSGPAALSGSAKKGKGKLKDEEDVVDGYHSLVVDVVDVLLEQVDTCLDEFSGKNKTSAIPKTTTLISETANTKKLPRLDSNILYAAHLSKPQLKFPRPPDNSSTPWKSTLKSKPHAIVPLDPSSSHPYRHEISHINYPLSMTQHSVPQPPQPFESTPLTWISTPHQLTELLSKLKLVREIAVDLEHHDYRTYAGFLCLMQISTREEDFVVDTLALRDELEILNEVFADPQIVKVLHGANHDILWLQQDFNLYMVNMFDTYHAAAVLDFPKKSLAALLSLYCNFTADKRYQLADWRIRPLPEEMLFYARSDTHFLLYVYDSLRNALIDRANGQTTAIYEVLRRSEKTALNTYVKESYDSQFGSGLGGWDHLARQWNKALFGNTKAIFIAIHAWRDQVAREEDESTKFVLPNRFLFSLAERPPTTIAGLLIMVQPASPIVKARTQELLTVIKEASEAHVAPIEASKSTHSTGGDVRTSETQTNITQDAMLTDINDSVEIGLWDHARNQAVLSTKSSLFGPTIEPSPNTLPYIASKSTLFGSFGAAVSHSTHDDRFQEIVHKIHNNLVLSPSIARIMRSAGLQPPAAISEKAKIQPDPEPEIPKEPEQLPFIPAAQRQTTSTNNLIGGQSSNKKGKAREDDTSDPEIVQVGAPKAKKRKRNKRLEELSTENGENSVSSSTSPPMDDQQPKNGGSKGSLEDIKDFDYSSVPNLLDENMDSIQEESQRPGKKRKTRNPSKGAKGLDGGFPSAPKARNEPKSGNRSITYK